ncbi:MAG: sigma 54-interacting transcriptional regulator [Deltaproteobacteria bacterium]|nr:sigma 54-interacting transcriptional regulator [Desulfobacterales bacterium]MDH3897325.1 sigma 54-interacting transcriptional regulator [Deltaproteobacteria bacterium]
MRYLSLKNKLLFAVSALVVFSGILISLIVSQRYSKSLLEAAAAQAENIAHSIVLEATDKILINDMVALQKMLDHHIRSNPPISYLFIVKDGEILAHTFLKGIPASLINVNQVKGGEQFRLKEISSTEGDKYLDIAWPIFDGKAGVLRMGYSEEPYRQKLTKLWTQMIGITLVILFLSISLTLIFVRRITRPLAELAEATSRIDEGEVDVRVKADGRDEIGKLASSFNHMVARMEEYTHRLEEQTMELERANQQARISCEIVKELGALRNMNEIGIHLITRFKSILQCNRMLLLLFNETSELLFNLTERKTRTFTEPEIIQNTLAALEGRTKLTFMENDTFQPPLIPADFQGASGQAVITFGGGDQPFGALIIACEINCKCNKDDFVIVDLILSQSAGSLKRAIMQEEELGSLQSRIDKAAGFGDIIGKDHKMQLVFKLLEDIAPTDATVLIQGESGTGKELVAKAIHTLSPRKDEPFVVVNCSAYPVTLLESELFGHEKGAFTGAIRQKSGRFEQAHGGTLFLDEIGEIPPSAQIKLLRILQTKRFERLGGEKTVSVNVRIIAATNKDLEQEVKKANFREDLYYRLNVIPVFLPPLIERGNDIVLLARHFLSRFAAEQGKEIREFTPEAIRLLLDYPWPGNVRELQNTIEHAAVLAKGKRIEPSDLPQAVIQTRGRLSEATRLANIVEHEIRLLEETLEECGWNKKLAAERLGISRTTLYTKLKKYQIQRPTSH